MNLLSQEFFEQEFDDFELEHMPEVKALLHKHIIWEFEGETETDDTTLKGWLWYLHQQGRILELFSAAWVYSESRHRRDAQKYYRFPNNKT